MPTYAYSCTKCSEEFEVYQTFSDEPLKRHPGCGGSVQKVFSPVGIVLKGSGFYKNDSGSRSKSKSTSKSESSESKSETKSESSSTSDSSSSKSDSKSDSKSSSNGSSSKPDSKTSKAAK
jgi:putative FmdB family regulatory protein